MSYSTNQASLYRHTFDLLDSSVNLIVEDKHGCGFGTFWVRHYLETNITYILVAKDSERLVSKGFANVTVDRLSKSTYHRRHHSLLC